MKQIILCALLGLVCWIISGCNTVHGAGQDIQNAGQGIKDVSK